jgi:hypothetical protein
MNDLIGMDEEPDQMPNMYCMTDEIEFFWTRWESDDELPTCPRCGHELDWIGT